jgi:hypothetical protein
MLLVTAVPDDEWPALHARADRATVVFADTSTVLHSNQAFGDTPEQLVQEWEQVATDVAEAVARQAVDSHYWHRLARRSGTAGRESDPRRPADDRRAHPRRNDERADETPSSAHGQAAGRPSTGRSSALSPGCCPPSYDKSGWSHDLEDWMTAVEASDLPALHAFVRGLRKDLDAVVAGLSLPYSNGPIEGTNTKFKLLKRQMYGRAGFALLRQRILLS